MTLSEIYNYRDAGEGIGTAGQPTEDQLRAVAGEGFETVINLALHDDKKYSLPDEAGLVRELGMSYVHIPVQFAAPTEGDLLAFFEAMEANAERKVFVHCAANKRVTAFLGLYRVVKLGWERERAFELMSGVWEADAVWSAFIEGMIGKYGR